MNKPSDSGFRSEVKPTYRLFTEDQIKEIHRATLEVLETVGVKVNHDDAITLLKQAGCTIKDNNIVLIPNWLVEESIRSAPSRINIYTRDGTLAMQLEGNKSYFGLGTDLKYTIDVNSGEHRLSVLQDVYNAAKVADFCDEIDFLASYALPSDVPTNLMYLNCVKAQIETSNKPIFFTAGGKEDLAFAIEMGEKVVGGAQKLKEKPFMIHYSEPVAPLMHSYGAVQKLFYCAEKMLPIVYVPGVLMGASGPATLAGGIVQANAEALSGIVLHQLKQKGAPIISGWAVVPLDMKTMIYAYGAPDYRLTNTAFADLYHYYGLPCWSIVGTDSMTMDAQAGIEHGIAVLLAAMDGANLIHDIAYLGQGLVGSPASIVMGDELISFVKRILRGFEITPEKLAVDIIRQIGPGGDFMSHKHTLENFRQELWRPKLFNRDPPETWKMKGANTYDQKVTEKARQILSTHTGHPLAAESKEEINKIYKKAEEVLKNISFRA